MQCCSACLSLGWSVLLSSAPILHPAPGWTLLISTGVFQNVQQLPAESLTLLSASPAQPAADSLLPQRRVQHWESCPPTSLVASPAQPRAGNCSGPPEPLMSPQGKGQCLPAHSVSQHCPHIAGGKTQCPSHCQPHPGAGDIGFTGTLTAQDVMEVPERGWRAARGPHRAGLSPGMNPPG